MTALEHSDRILAAAPGSWVLACEPVWGVNMGPGGRLDYGVGARFRVRHGSDDLLWCLAQGDGRRVTFGREQMSALERG